MDALSIAKQKQVLMDKLFRAVQAFESVTGDNVIEIRINRLIIDRLDKSKNKNVCTDVTVNIEKGV